MISDGTFSDIYVGDVIVSNRVTWLVADIDNYLYSGKDGTSTAEGQHHLTIIPATTLVYGGLNSTNTTEGGYIKSEIYTGKKRIKNEDGSISISDEVTTLEWTLDRILNEKIEPAFSGHVLTYSASFPETTNMDGISAGAAGWKGSSVGAVGVDRTLDLMTEINVYGSQVLSSSGSEGGADNRQYALFQLRPEMINSYGTTRFDYWLRNVVYWQDFTFVANDGISGSWYPTYPRGIRPRFLIG